MTSHPLTPSDPVLPLGRRRLLAASLGLGAAAAAAGLPGLVRAALAPTPTQTEGPFYPRSRPEEHDADLVRVAGQSGEAAGDIIHVTGRVLSPDGSPIAGARVEIWQADTNGRYRHVFDWSLTRSRDDAFQGFGVAETDDSGAYAFRTVRPANYGSRTRHIHFKVFARSLPTLTTQMYFAGEPLNARDGVLNAIADPAARERLIVPFRPAPETEPGAQAGRFDIVLGAA